VEALLAHPHRHVVENGDAVGGCSAASTARNFRLINKWLANIGKCMRVNVCQDKVLAANALTGDNPPRRLQYDATSQIGRRGCPYRIVFEIGPRNLTAIAGSTKRKQ